MSRVPETIEGAKSELNSLAFATDWRRAQIVYAFTRDGGRGGRPMKGQKPATNSRLSPVEFAALGIVGLGHHSTVSWYRKEWQRAIDNGWTVAVNPGDDALLPTEPFIGIGISTNKKSTPSSGTTAEEVKAVLAAEPEIRKEIKAELKPEIKEQIKDEIQAEMIEEIAADHGLTDKVNKQYKKNFPTPAKPAKPPASFIAIAFGAVVYQAVNRKQEELREFLDVIGREDDPQMREVIHEQLGNLADTRSLILRYEEEIKKAAGIDYDATFVRLVQPTT